MFFGGLMVLFFHFLTPLQRYKEYKTQAGSAACPVFWTSSAKQISVVWCGVFSFFSSSAVTRR